nr:LytS/YhcK type 5TM receptor domain-containing protein [Spirochaetota bacterium]
MEIALEFIYNFGIILSVCVLSGLVAQHFNDKIINPILNGSLFAFAALIGMINPVIVSKGLIFDGRSIIISVAGLFFGPIPAAFPTMASAFLRILQGGAGAKTGTFVILWSFFAGISGYYLIKYKIIKLNFFFI